MEPMQPSPKSDAARERPSWLRRVGWLALIWASSVAALFVVAVVFRAAMAWVGLTPPAS